MACLHNNSLCNYGADLRKPIAELGIGSDDYLYVYNGLGETGVNLEALNDLQHGKTGANRIFPQADKSKPLCAHLNLP